MIQSPSLLKLGNVLNVHSENEWLFYCLKLPENLRSDIVLFQNTDPFRYTITFLHSAGLICHTGVGNFLKLNKGIGINDLLGQDLQNHALDAPKCFFCL